MLIIGPTLISHGATIGTGGGTGAWPRVILDRRFIGAGASVLAPRGKSIRIGIDAAIGASAHVFSDVPDGHRMGAAEAVVVRVVDTQPDQTHRSP